MKKLPLLGLVALATMITAPAMARSWDRLGTVGFGTRLETERQWTGFSGRADGLMLTADREGVRCRNVNVRFGNGRTRNVFSGVLREDRPRVIDLPGNDRDVRSISMTCRSLGRHEAVVTIAADIDRYRSTWKRGYNSSFNFSLPLGSVSFGRTYGRDQEFAGFTGRRIDEIAVRATNNDAQCRSARVRFANGHSRTVAVGERYGMLKEDVTYHIDLPGDNRNVTNVSMVCRAREGRSVTIALYGQHDLGHR